MNPTRKKRLFIILFIVVGASIAIGLTLYALRANVNLFFSPAQVVAGSVPQGAHIRCAGLVVKGSVVRSPNSLDVQFDIADKITKVTVHYVGILPDLFREGQGIMVTGKVDEAGILQADEVLAKHDENYMPPEMKDMMEKQSTPAIVK